ncbi:MAG: hypothetical protein DRP13_00835 [Candidatus Aenigmatarchaeota archaeon]|nr:MAG: hypothetical protein DRP13_00835 [Candidatus Aenigmarchaeota archaeon]
MNWKTSLIVFIMLLLVSPVQSSALSIGAAPGIANLGKVYPGQNKLVDVYLILSKDAPPLLVTLNYVPAHIDFFYKNHTHFIPALSSNEDISSWLVFPENPVLVLPTNTIIHTFPNGEVVKANKKVTGILHIPEDADPGYHVGSIDFSPRLPSGRQGTGLATIAITRFLFVFYVEKNEKPKREGKITDIEVYRESDKRVRIDILFRNTGTDTLLVRADNVKIYNNIGLLEKTLSSGYVRIKPKETGIISVYWYNTSKIESGDYRIEASTYYITGSSFKEKYVKVPQAVFVPTGKSITIKKEFPWWLIVIIIALVCVLIYWKY